MCSHTLQSVSEISITPCFPTAGHGFQKKKFFNKKKVKSYARSYIKKYENTLLRILRASVKNDFFQLIMCFQKKFTFTS